MRRVLLISYHFYPLDVVASIRIRRMAKSLSRKGWEVDVLTHDWKRNKDGWSSGDEDIVREEGTEGYRVIRLGTGSKYADRYHTGDWQRKFRILADWLRGWLDPNPAVRDGHEAMREWLFHSEDRSKEYERVVVTFSPHAHLKLGAEISERWKVPVHMDFRDLWDNSIVARDYQRKGIFHLKAPLIEHYWKRWIAHSAGISTISKPWAKYLEELSGKECKVVHTGFEPGDYPNVEVDREHFQIIYTGSVYNNQHLDLMLEGIRRFLEANDDERIRVRFIGSERKSGSNLPGSFLPSFNSLLSSKVGDPRARVEPRMSQIEIRTELRHASVLLMPTLRTRGWFSGKFFEYLGAGRFILIAPEDEEATADLLRELGAGAVANTVDEVSTELEAAYERWSKQEDWQPEVRVDGEFGMGEVV